MIDVKHLSKSFGEVEVLKDINETIEKGEKVVIVGPSGSGKSTFLRCLNLMEKPTSGDIFFEGENITQANEHEMNKLRQRMGMVFQHFNLFPHLTIKKNITLAPVKLGLMTADEADKKAEELLERVGLPDKADEYPSRLSGGQKQRIAIARSLAMNPEVMLFDEPTSALDPEMVGEVLELLGYYTGTVKTAYYELQLGAKVSEAQEDADMLDIIWKSLVSDIGLVCCNCSGSMDNLVYMPGSYTHPTLPTSA